MEQIPFHRPFPLEPYERKLVLERIDECMKSGQVSNGKYVELLENKIKEMYNVEYCIATSSCTQGLLACVLYELVNYITLPAFIWKSLDFIKGYFLEPYWIDIDRNTWIPNKKCDIGLHTFGNVMLGNYTIGDASHCLGVKFKKMGLAEVFSLAPTKLITSCEGGLVITNNEKLYKYVKEYRDKCARMSEIHAIIGLQTLLHLDEVKRWKKEVYEYYKAHIRGQFQEIPYDSNYNTIGFLNVNNLEIPEHITTKQYYEPLKKGLKNTDYIYENMVVLPSFHGVNYKGIVESIKEANK